MGTQGGLGCRCQWGSAGSGYGRGNGNVDWLHPRVSSHPVNGSATHDWNGPGRWGTSGGEADGRRVVELTLLVQSHAVMWMMEGLDGMLRGGRAADGGPSSPVRTDPAAPFGRWPEWTGWSQACHWCLFGLRGGWSLGPGPNGGSRVAYQPVLVGVRTGSCRLDDPSWRARRVACARRVSTLRQRLSSPVSAAINRFYIGANGVLHAHTVYMQDEQTKRRDLKRPPRRARGPAQCRNSDRLNSPRNLALIFI